MKSREKFVEEVAETIRREHSKDDSGSFIFGISGKWGEGKTYFLNQLATQLTDFEIIRINPWKFTGDRTSFLRDFLRQLKQVKLYQDSKFWPLLLELVVKRKKTILRKFGKALRYELFRERDFLVEDDFYKLESDTFGLKINKANFLLVGLLIILLLSVYFNLELFLSFTPIFIQSWLDSNKYGVETLLKGIGVVGFIALLGKVITTQTNTKAASTVDQFDLYLSKILKKLKGRKLLVLVDDLDRVTPEIARNVLDDLRTFFDRKEISFVVTGDHSVLERYIGIQTLQGGLIGEQLEEGRRFLKKIFNYYWRLPVPIDQEFELFVNDKFTQNNDQLSSIFNQEQLVILKSYLNIYFEKNFRQVTRFLDSVLFTFKIIELQLEGSDDNNKKYFEELKKFPLLVVRILMIQDLCTPLFEEMLKNPRILFDLEYAAEKSDSPKIEALISEHSKDLSSSRKAFISRFLLEKPRFYEETRLTVLAIQPFLYLAADASFGDARGPSPADFKVSLQTNDPEQIKKALLDSGEQRIKEASQATHELYDETNEQNQKHNYLKALLSALVGIPKEHNSQQIFCESLINLDFSSSLGGDPTTRMEFVNLFWKWLDIVPDKDNTAKYKTKFPLTDTGDINLIDPANTGKFSSQVITNWLCQFYKSNESGGLEKLMEIIPKLDTEVVSEELENIKDTMVTDLINNAEPADARDKRFNLIQIYFKNGISSLKDRIFSSIKGRNEDIWNWAVSKADPSSVSGMWTPADLQQQLIATIRETVHDPQTFMEAFRFCNGKINSSLKEFWDVIINEKYEHFFSNFEGLTDDASLSPLVPSTSTATLIYKKIAKSIEGIEDDKKIQIIHRLGPDKWLWTNYNHLFAKRDLKVLISKVNQNVREQLESIVSRWQENHTQ